ncbi:MAG: TonB-dependent receptor [bacterium]
MRRRFCSIALSCAVGVGPVHAQDRAPAVLDTLHVTATWAPLAPDKLPETVTVVEGESLRQRGATDLRSALALVSGVEAVPGGDAGPASSVPALWGLREFDAFLLVVDGIPWGGAFIPNLPTLDLNDVDRIEVLRGPAPITYGSTSFVGVIHVFHRKPGAGRAAEVSGGSFGTVRGSAGLDVGKRGRLSLDGGHEGFKDDDAGVDRGHARYRLDLPQGLHVDADVAVLEQGPTSPHLRAGATLDPTIPMDANHNPKDAKLDTTRLSISATQSMKLLNWVAAYSHVDDDIIRGFLADGSDDGATPNANGYKQKRHMNEVYGSAHHRFVQSTKLGVTAGFDVLFGQGKENSNNFRYYAPLNGRRVHGSADGVPVEDTEFESERTFLGLFAEADWHPAPGWTVLGGARLNGFDETRDGEHEENGVDVPETVKDDKTRLGGRLGVTWQAWRSETDELALFVDARDTFKPPALDFGPEAEVDPLKPETARNVEVGLRTDLAQHRFRFDASAFRMDFENLVIATIVNGNPALANAGTERFDGVELDAEYQFHPQWRGIATYAWHDATFRDYETEFDGVPTQLAGKQLEMSPHHLASGGLAYGGPVLHADACVNYIGERFLNKRNTAPAEAYTTIDASIGARFGAWDVRVTGQNLGDRRDPVAESELGDAQYYRLPARTVEVATSVRL